MPTQGALLGEVRRRFRAGEGFALATVNLDHLVKMRASADFIRVYAGQDLVVADGWPIVMLSRLAARPVDLMPGSDLILPLAAVAAEQGVPVALVGSTEVALEDARRDLTARVPGLKITLAAAPSGRFDPEGAEAAEILARLDAAGIRLCFLALGAPKQETLALRGRSLAPAVGFASIGAGLDFLGGHQVRAPLWMRRVGLEWMWRMLSSPGRMVPRYARSAAVLPGQVLKALRLRWSRG
ncbi:WecB/TagA/CpsF family glycosyltransferase [Pseudodonghicola sp. IC7]|uniref:WecB/TagA/CpsF family glycosyltransferase n=2 Tax=Pseudodonghicola flavimaris TaxID=3050036 RepID=A0ABT7F3I9_9RHOB|nr:WecB/TagA/CpsF family glycosyltransferase [Pseudodonghicola flavimaris]MDK3019168.1 WecB/TagA/CpsF family glycosyltransferase [Pseudodonghicola flavimaris]